MLGTLRAMTCGISRVDGEQASDKPKCVFRGKARFELGGIEEEQGGFSSR